MSDERRAGEHLRADGYNAGLAEELYERSLRERGIVPPSLADLVEREGTNVWFERSDAELAAELGCDAVEVAVADLVPGATLKGKPVRMPRYRSRNQVRIPTQKTHPPNRNRHP